MAMLKSWEEGKAEARAEGRAEGRVEGRAEAAAHAVLTALRVRGIGVADTVRQRILAETDLEQLDRWLRTAAVASSIEQMVDLE